MKTPLPLFPPRAWSAWRFLVFGCALLALNVAPLRAFSPYENYLLSGRPTHAGLLAEVRREAEAEVFEALARLSAGDGAARMARAGITGLASFSREIGGRSWVVVYFAYEGGRDYLGAAAAFEAAVAADTVLFEGTVPHPRAERLGTHWLQMEWINFIRGFNVPGPAAEKLMIVTTIKPEKEERYRTLHQTVWPGVVDQLIRSRNRNLSIFLATIDDRLVEFLYLEYMGDDREKDEAMSQTDDINRRWWALTDACQYPLPGVDGIWDLMRPVTPEAAVVEEGEES